MDEEILAKVKKAAVIGAFFGVALLFYFLRWHAALKIYVVLVGLCATLAILIQSGKGGGLAASFGGLGGESLLGVRSATPIAKATYVMLALFLFICMLVARMPVPTSVGGGLSDKLGEQPPAAKLPPAPTPTAPAAMPPAQTPPATTPAATPPATAPATQPGGAPTP